MPFHLDVLASITNFAGGLFLALEALHTRRAVKERRGTEALLDAIKRKNQRSADSDDSLPIYDDNETPLRTREAIEEWFAKRSSKYAWIGFSFLSVGFGLDLISKLHSPSSLP
jgi:hypothetical protein